MSAVQFEKRLNLDKNVSSMDRHQLDIQSRIIAVADIFQALAQARSYRDAKPLEEILRFLTSSVEKGRINGSIVEIVTQNSEKCNAMSMG